MANAKDARTGNQLGRGKCSWQGKGIAFAIQKQLQGCNVRVCQHVPTRRNRIIKLQITDHRRSQFSAVSVTDRISSV